MYEQLGTATLCTRENNSLMMKGQKFGPGLLESKLFFLLKSISAQAYKIFYRSWQDNIWYTCTQWRRLIFYKLHKHVYLLLSQQNQGRVLFRQGLEFYLPMTAAIFRNCPNIQLCGGLAPASLKTKFITSFFYWSDIRSAKHSIIEYNGDIIG